MVKLDAKFIFFLVLFHKDNLAYYPTGNGSLITSLPKGMGCKFFLSLWPAANPKPFPSPKLK